MDMAGVLCAEKKKRFQLRNSKTCVTCHATPSLAETVDEVMAFNGDHRQPFVSSLFSTLPHTLHAYQRP